jgi:hypothetical protein
LCVAAWWLFTLDRLRLRLLWRRVFGAGIAIAGLLLWVVLFPVVLRGTEALGDTPDAEIMYRAFSEMRSITTGAQVVALLLNGAIAAALLLWLAVRDRKAGWKFALWTYSGCCLIGLEVLGQVHVRFAVYPSAVAAALLPVALTECTRLLTGRSQVVQATARIAVLAIMLLSMRAEALATLYGQLNYDRIPTDRPSFCNLQKFGSKLAPLSGEVVLTDIDDVPALLYRTNIKTVGSLYRGVAGFIRLRAAWRSGPSEVEPEEVRATRAAFVLYCRKAGRSGLVGDLPEQTLWDRLARGEVPAWLQAVASDAQLGIVLYRIVDRVPDGILPGEPQHR